MNKQLTWFMGFDDLHHPVIIGAVCHKIGTILKENLAYQFPHYRIVPPSALFGWILKQ